MLESACSYAMNNNAINREIYSNSTLKNRITIGGVEISVIAPLGHQNSGLTKAGRISLKGVHEGCFVKVYSCSTNSQCLFRKSIETHRFRGILLPELVATDGIYIVEKWIHGSPATQIPKTALAPLTAEFLSDLHESSNLKNLSFRHQDAFCYLEFLFDRVKKWNIFDDVCEFWNICRKIYVSHRDTIPITATHPDVTEQNIIREQGSGRFFLVDNELLSAGRGWILDHRNSLLGSFPNWSTGTKPSPAHELVHSLWALRQVGSALHRGDIVSALDLCRSECIRQRDSAKLEI